MNLSYSHTTTLLLIAVLVLGIALGRCSTDIGQRVIIEEKKIPVEIRIPSVEVQKTVDTVTVVHNSPDSSAIKRLIGVRDSLRRELAKRNVGVLFGLDTITPSRDTIQVTCDEIERRITARIRFGQRDTTIRYLDTTTYLPPKSARLGLSGGFGAAIVLENNVPVLRPAIFVGITYSLFNF